MSELKNNIGGRLREARLKTKPKTTQIELIARLELRGIYLNETAISKIEAGKRPVNDLELVSLARSLNVTLNWLTSFDDDSQDKTGY